MPADRLVKLPDKIDYKTGAAMMLQGMTVRYLLRETYKVGKGTTMLLHAAAGGIGLIACQWARHLGATIIGTVSTPEKAELAKEYGCTHVINYKTRGLREAHEGAHQRPGRRRRLRRGRQGHLSGLARLPEAAGPVGDLRQRLRRDHQLRHPAAVGEGLALRHAAHARHLHRQARRPAGQRRRAVRRGRQGHRQDQRQPHLCLEGCRQGAPRSRGAQDHRLHRAAALPYTVRHSRGAKRVSGTVRH